MPFAQNGVPAEEHYSFNLQPNNSVLLQRRVNTVGMNTVHLFVSQSTYLFNSAGTKDLQTVEMKEAPLTLRSCCLARWASQAQMHWNSAVCLDFLREREV